MAEGWLRDDELRRALEGEDFAPVPTSVIRKGIQSASTAIGEHETDLVLRIENEGFEIAAADAADFEGLHDQVVRKTGYLGGLVAEAALLRMDRLRLEREFYARSAKERDE